MVLEININTIRMDATEVVFELVNINRKIWLIALYYPDYKSEEESTLSDEEY